MLKSWKLYIIIQKANECRVKKVLKKSTGYSEQQMASPSLSITTFIPIHKIVFCTKKHFIPKEVKPVS